jgi:nitrogen fixation protein FixH
MTKVVALSSKAARPITGRFVLIAFLAFFGTIATVNGVMMALAIRTMPGLDVRNGYDASQRYNGEISAMRDQALRHWQVNVALSLQGTRAPITVTLREDSGRPLEKLRVIARLAHPTDRRIDHEIELKEGAPGHYTAAFDDVTRGGWVVVVEAWQDGSRRYISRNRVFLTE